MGSLEFCCGALGSKLVVVLGHSQCGAIQAARSADQSKNQCKATEIQWKFMEILWKSIQIKGG